jgi:rod shape-determining protein MreC
MDSLLGRYRNLTILVGILFLQVLGLAVQVKRGTNQDTRLIRVWTVGAITPFERGLVWIQTSSANLWHNYFYLRGVRAENRQLKQQIEDMRLQDVRLSEDAAQARRLQTLFSFKEQFIEKGDTVAAQVIGSSGSDLSRVLYIDKGENAGIKRDMAVITADGIVGKVLMAYPSTSQVLLISDQSSGVGAMLDKSRLQGVLRGTPNGEVVLERVMADEQVAVGETVLTSGGDQIFPKGLPVGKVTKVGSGRDLFLSIQVKPAANLSTLEEVLVVVKKREQSPVAEENVRVRAADILAQRLPSVPDKPADANSTAANPESTPTQQTKPSLKSGTAAAPPNPLPANRLSANPLPSSPLSADQGTAKTAAAASTTTSAGSAVPTGSTKSHAAQIPVKSVSTPSVPTSGALTEISGSAPGSTAKPVTPPKPKSPTTTQTIPPPNGTDNPN